MHRISRRRVAAGVILLALPLASVAELRAQSNNRNAAGTADSNDWRLPIDPDRWINSSPLSREALEGKGIVMVFFHEECTQCAAQWPNVQRAAEAYADKPVLFLAVNSGTDPRLLRAYASKNRLKWPVVADVDSALANALSVPRLSPPDRSAEIARRLGSGTRPRNPRDDFQRGGQSQGPTVHVKFVSGEGVAGDVDVSDLGGAVEKALEGASWRVDPSGIPGPLRAAWRSTEIGAYPAAASAITKAVKKEGPLKSGGEKLLDYVKQELSGEADVVRSALSDNDAWEAYKLLGGILSRYDGYGLTEKAEAKRDELAKLDAVRSELSARKALDKAIRTGAKGAPAAVRRAKGMLERIVESSPGTEAAERAQEILAGL